MIKGKLFWGCWLAVLGMLLLQFSPSKPSNELAVNIRTSASDFVSTVAELEQQASAYKLGQADLQSLQAGVLRTRKAWKQVEFLLEFYYPGYVEEFINGAPLMHIEYHSTRPIVVPPEGLQVLDELVFSEEAEAQKAEISMLTRQLLNRSRVLVAGLEQRQFNDYEVLEAVREQLIRIFSLGVTGFDTPGSLSGIQEAEASLQVLHTAAGPFLEMAHPQSAKDIHSRFEKAIAYLHENGDFDSFDRLSFLKEHINPLYRGLLELRHQLGLKPSREWESARNPDNSNLFAEDFLNPYFYTELREDEDNDQLRSLGEKLFYDPLLSANGRMSCGTCHNPSKAFTDGVVKSASNVVGQSVQRNAPTLLNAVYADRYFYDLRAFTLEQQAEHVIFNQHEFNTANAEILAKLNTSEEYRKLFKKATGTRDVQQEDFAKALTSYVLSLRSFNSEFDRYVRGELQEIDPKVKDGFNIFMGKAACGTCHFSPTFSGLVPPLYAKNESEILGVLETPRAWSKKLDDDMGRYANEIYSEEAWIFERSFKTTTVRNVELTAPYFHNGAYQTLEEVVNFYNHGGGAGLGLEVKNQTLAPDSLHLTSAEKQALIAFMKSLTDTSAAFSGTNREPLSAIAE